VARRPLEDDGAAPYRPTVVRLMPDYGGIYLWDLSPRPAPSHSYSLEPHDLGLSAGLTDRLTEWFQTWERGWGRMSRRFGGVGGTGGQGWYEQGLRLAHQLQKELGPDVEVVYRDARGEERPISDLPRP
jgi:hypothetical protein